MRKIFVLDTNVLIHDPHCIYNFRGNDVILPIYVVEEIDKLKRNQNTAIQARMVSRTLDEIRKKGSLARGVNLPEDIFFKVEIANDLSLLPQSLSKGIVDNNIISVTLGIKRENPDRKVIIVSKDINMRIKADSLGIEVEDYTTDRVEYSELYDGYFDVEVSKEVYDNFNKSGKVSFRDLGKIDIIPTPNSFFRLKYKDHVVSGRYSNGRIKKFILGDSELWGVRARNEEQRYAVELLLDDDVKVCTLIGGAGTGKTLLAIAAGLDLVVDKKRYKKIFIARPIIPMGKDLGYLPGSEKEKMKPWMQPIFDNIDFLCQVRDEENGEKLVMSLENKGMMKIEPLTYIRGRSIPKGLIIIDEAQNLTPLEIKTIVTRAGQDTKIIFTGDPQQIDNPYLDANTNGLTYMADRLKYEKIVGHITLKKGERSEIAEIAAKLL